MPFSTLNKAWSNLAPYYNSITKDGAFTTTKSSQTLKPQYPKIQYTNFDDGFIRGGAINMGIAAARDTVRIGNFLKSPKGLVWVAKQVGLQKANPELEQPENFKTNFLSNNDTRLYNFGVNTLTQVPLNGLGGHVIRHGITPVSGIGFLNGDTNNIKGYNYEKITTNNNKNYNFLYPSKTFNRLSYYLNKLAFSDSYNTINLLEYNGGASSVYGIGKTRINTTTTRTTVDNSKLVIGTPFAQNLNGFNPLTSLQILSSSQANLDTTLDTQLKLSPLLDLSVSSSYNIETRIGVSTKRKSSYTVDSINVINITDSTTFYDNSNDGKNPNKLSSNVLTSYKDKVEGYYGNDIIKFRLEFLNNDEPVTNSKIINTDVLAFRAYLDDFNDGMSAKWNSYRYMGRGEEFYVYEGFTRDISVAFTLYAHSPEEMAPLYKKLNYLMSTFTPDYSAQNKMRGNIGYLTVGDYLYRQPGVFTDIKLSGMLDTHWEIALDKESDQYEVPKHIKINLSFKPIHTFLPRKIQKDKYANTPFITVDKYSYPVQAPKGNKYLD
jgi:hypothetical protein